MVLARAIASIAVGVTQPALLACSGAPFAAAIPPAPCGGLRAWYWQPVVICGGGAALRARWWALLRCFPPLRWVTHATQLR